MLGSVDTLPELELAAGAAVWHFLVLACGGRGDTPRQEVVRASLPAGRLGEEASQGKQQEWDLVRCVAQVDERR